MCRTCHLEDLTTELMRYDQIRLWATDAIMYELIFCVYVCVVYAWMCEYMKVLMCGCMNVWMYECDLNDHINCIWQVTRWNETGHVRLEGDWHRGTNTRQTSLELILSWTNWAIGGMKPGTRWQPMPLGKPTHWRLKVWEKSPFVNGSRVFFPRYASAVIVLFLFVKIPNFCLDRPFGFSVHREYIPFCAPNFCLDRPFGFSVHRDAHFCLSRLFRFSA